jgi:hypothetical protein
MFRAIHVRNAACTEAEMLPEGGRAARCEAHALLTMVLSLLH